MKAFQIRSPGDYSVIDAPMPEISDEEVLVKVGYAAICHSDIDMLTGARKHLITYPNIGGHEFAGTIVKCGSKVDAFSQGDTVVCECMILCRQCAKCDSGSCQCENYSELGFMRNGGYAEYVAVPARNCHKFTKMTMEQAALTEPLGNGFAIAEAANIQPWDTVAVIGPGPIGLYALECAKLYHPKKTIMIGTRYERLKHAEGVADELINIREEDPVKKVMEITEGKGVTVVLMCATTTQACQTALEIAGKDCRIMIEGLGDGTPVPVNFSDFVIKVMTIKGVAGVTSMQFRKVIELVESGVIDPVKYATHKLPLDDIEKGFEILRARNQDAVKILIEP
jgi:L-iditol 2-dehydrogenase